MRYLLVLISFLSFPAHAQEAPEEVRGALAHVMFAHFCETNDDARSIELAQRVLDDAQFQEASAQEAFDAAAGQQTELSEVTREMGCSMVDRIERDHPFK